MVFTLPFLVLLLGLTWFLLTRIIFPDLHKAHGDQRPQMRTALQQLGPFSQTERRVSGVFGLVIMLWLLRPFIDKLAPPIALSDTGIAIFGAILLFLIPANWQRGHFLMDWKTAEQLPWGTLLLFGGGLSLAASINQTGLAAWLGNTL